MARTRKPPREGFSYRFFNRSRRMSAAAPCGISPSRLALQHLSLHLEVFGRAFALVRHDLKINLLALV
jgi:hypothetical protein